MNDLDEAGSQGQDIIEYDDQEYDPFADGLTEYGLARADRHSNFDVERTTEAMSEALGLGYDDAKRFVPMVWIEADMVQSVKHDEYKLLFNLARRLKGVVEDSLRDERGASIMAPYSILFRDLLVGLNKMPLEYETEYIHWGDDQQVTFAFETAWCKARYTLSEGLIASARKFAYKNADALDSVSNYNLRMVICIAWFIQKQTGKKPFFLPVKVLGDALLVSPQFASDLLHGAQRLKYIRKVGVGKRKENRFRFISDCFDRPKE